ncbi:MAG: hypothetical protein IPO30_07950 [Hyphomonadaceae bacterium]|nr:hypothetical protein [Hyphomonadaceae bacterium]
MLAVDGGSLSCGKPTKPGAQQTQGRLVTRILGRILRRRYAMPADLLVDFCLSR